MFPAYFCGPLFSGFSGEDEEAFQRLVDFVEDFRFERMGAFVYSEPPDTPSAFLYPKVEEKVKQERYKALMEVQEKVMGESFIVL